MNKCLNCSAEIIQKNGGKERKFCDNNNACKQAYYNKKNGSGYKPKRKHLTVEEYEALLSKIVDTSEQKEIQKKVVSDLMDYGMAKVNTPIAAKPEKLKGESDWDYRIRVAEWKEKQK